MIRYSEKSRSDIQRWWQRWSFDNGWREVAKGILSRKMPAADNGCNKTPIKSPPTNPTSITHLILAEIRNPAKYINFRIVFFFGFSYVVIVKSDIKAGIQVILSFITGLLINQREVCLDTINFPDYFGKP